jgi:hypothetical protein
MKRWFYALSASAALVACGLVHGYRTERWQPAVEATEAAGHLRDLPLEIGDWQGTEMEVKPGQAGAGVAGCIQRSYLHRPSGVTVSMALVCGRPGPVSIHTPDICYMAAGFSVGTPARSAVANSEAAMWRADAFRATASDEKRLRIFWGWNNGSGWVASENPRLEFARFPVLHKLYVIREMGGLNEANRDEPCEQFLQVLLPELDRALFAAGR